MRKLLILFLVVQLPIIARAEAPAQINLRQTVTVDIVKRTRDAVVNISTTKLVSRRVSPFGGDPFFGQMDMGQVVRVPANSLGSGFIIHREGYVVTNHHVIDRARTIVVELADGRKLPAELLSSDAEADLALLKIKGDKDFPTLELGDTSDLMIGEPCVAIGNPLGFSHSVSTGIVSAIHRDLKDNTEKVLLGDLVQTDAAINPGNSGGPLLNAYGQVIGINTAIRGDAQNIGFAIPVNRLYDLIPELMNPAQVNKVNVPIRLAERRVLTPPATITRKVIVNAKNDPPAITSINGQSPTDLIDAYAILLHTRPDQKFVEIKFAAGRSLRVDLLPVPKPDAVVQARDLLGIGIEPLTPATSQKYGLNSEDGMLITEVARGSVAAKAGLKAGDVIVQLGRYRVATLDDFGALLHQMPKGSGRVRIGVIRGDQVGYGILDP